MSDNIKVSPTPIQRNSADVAMELLNIHLQNVHFQATDIGGIYAQYFALAKTLEYKSPSDLKEFIPEEIAAKLVKYNR